MNPDISLATKSGHFYLLTTLTDCPQPDRNTHDRAEPGMETCIGLFPPNDWAGHRPNCRQITQCDSPIAEAETDTQDRVSIGTAFRGRHQGSLRASIGTLPGNVVGQAFGPREPESLAGLRFVPKLILCRTVRRS